MDLQFLTEPLQTLLKQIAAFLPGLAAAILVLLVGWLLAKAARFAIERGLRAVNFNVIGERAGLDDMLRQGGLETDTAGIIGVLVYWLVILAALIVACNSLGLSYITDILGKIMLFVPNLIVGLVILAFGSYFAVFVGNAISAYCTKIGARDSELLGKLARYALLVFVALIALDQINVGGDIVRETFLILFAGLVFSVGLAFGLGGRRWAARMLERWWPSQDPDSSNGKRD